MHQQCTPVGIGYIAQYPFSNTHQQRLSGQAYSNISLENSPSVYKICGTGIPWARGDALHSLLQTIFPVGSFSSLTYLWHQQCPVRMSSTATATREEVFPTAHFHPFSSNPVAPLPRQKNLNRTVYSKCAKKKKKSIHWHKDCFYFALSFFPRKSVFDMLYFNAIQHQDEIFTVLSTVTTL